MIQKTRKLSPDEDPTSLGTLAQIRFGISHAALARALEYGREHEVRVGAALVILDTLTRRELQSLLADQRALRRTSGATVHRLLGKVRARSEKLSGDIGQLEKLALEVAGKLQ